MSSTAEPIAIDEDVPCGGCGYNLRTLSKEGVCPECSRSVAESLRLFRIHHSELGKLRANGLPWLIAMQRGVNLAALAWCFSTVGVVYGLTDMDAPESNSIEGAIWLFPFVATWVLSHLASWRLMAARQRTKMLAVARAGLVLSIVAIGLTFINDRLVHTYAGLFTTRWVQPPQKLLETVQLAGGFGALLWPLVAAATFGRLVQIAWLGRRFVAAVLLGICGLSIAGLDTFIAIALLGPFGGIANSQVVLALVGPTGSFPAAWIGIVDVVRHPLSFSFLSASDVLMALLTIGAVYGIFFTSGVVLFMLRKTLGRAIALSWLDDREPPSIS